MAELGITAVILVGLALKGAGIFALVYLGSRMAIRHERRISH